MPRYFTAPKQPRSWIADDWEEPVRHIPTVSDHEPTDTGLIDVNGDSIWRAPNPIGFIWEHPTHD